MKNEMKQYIAKDETEKLFDLLIANKYIGKNKDYYNEVILMYSNFSMLNKQQKNNVISEENYYRYYNKIKIQLINYIDSLPDEYLSESNLVDIKANKLGYQLVEATIDKNVEEFIYDQKESFIRQIASIAKIDPSKIVIVQLRDGSLKISFTIPTIAALLLIQKFKSRKNTQLFKNIKIKDIKIKHSSIFSTIDLIVKSAYFYFANNRKLLIGFVSFVLISFLFYYMYINSKSDRQLLSESQNKIELKIEEITSNIMIISSLNEDLRENANKLLEKTQVSEEFYSNLTLQVKDLEEKYLDMHGNIKELNHEIDQFNKIVNKILKNISNPSQENLAMQQTRTLQELMQNKIININKLAESNKTDIQLIKLLVEIASEVNKTKKSKEIDKLIIASNSFIEKLASI